VARPRHARPVQAACRMARRHLREHVRAGRRQLEDQGHASLRELRRAVREGLGAARAGRGARAERGLEGLPAGPPADGGLQALPRGPRAPVPGAPSGHRHAGEGGRPMSAKHASSRFRRIVLVAVCVPAFGAMPAWAQTSAAPASAEARLAAYRERVARLEDQDAIENLQAMFGYFFDKGMWEDAADCFTQDGRFEYGQSGVYIGRERIRRAMLLLGPEGLGQGYLNNHMQLQPVITFAPDGKTATG